MSLPRISLIKNQHTINVFAADLFNKLFFLNHTINVVAADFFNKNQHTVNVFTADLFNKKCFKPNDQCLCRGFL